MIWGGGGNDNGGDELPSPSGSLLDLSAQAARLRLRSQTASLERAHPCAGATTPKTWVIQSPIPLVRTYNTLSHTLSKYHTQLVKMNLDDVLDLKAEVSLFFVFLSPTSDQICPETVSQGKTSSGQECETNPSTLKSSA